MDLLPLLLLLCVGGCLCQRDCTGADCPELHNCIEEVLESGACCSTCAQTGCRCEGYQYYDCVYAGFQKGRVPEGKSYFVDFGSTECSCPQGGGRISCRFIPCPELPGNCIEVSEPADGCPQCKRIGCVYKEQKYEAGHTFHMDPCQVCHCPHDGGNLMCYPIPDCDPRRAHQPMTVSTTEETQHGRRPNDPIRHVLNPHGSFSRPFLLSHGDNLPPFKLRPSPEDEEGEEEDGDYDYAPTESFGPSLHNLVSPTETSAGSVDHPESNPAVRAFPRDTKQELKERFGVHDMAAYMPPFPFHKDGSATILAVAESKETTDGKRFELRKDTHKKDALNISDHHTGKAELNIPEDSTNEDRFPTYRQSADNAEASILRDTTERQSFSLFKDNAERDAPERKNTESEAFAVPKETADGVGFDYEDIRFSEAFIHSPLNVTQTPPHLQGTAAVTQRLVTPNAAVTQRLVTPNTAVTQRLVTPNTAVTQRLVTPNTAVTQRLVTPNTAVTQRLVTPNGTSAALVLPFTMSAQDNYISGREEVSTKADQNEPTGPLRDVTDSGGNHERNRIFGEGEENAISGPEAEKHSEASSSSTTSPAPETPPAQHGTEPTRKPRASPAPTIRLDPTSQPPLRVKEDEKQTPIKQSPSLFTEGEGDVGEEEKQEREERENALNSFSKGHEALVESCCEVGRKWATETQHCSHLPPGTERSVCGTVQEQCCVGALRENRCLVGMNTAKAGKMCEESSGPQCGEDSQKECCRCCAFGLRMRRETKGCDMHQYLIYPCGHIFLTCCEEGASTPELRRKERPIPTILPRRVADGQYPKQPLSLEDSELVANSVEKPEAVDECERYNGQLCHQMCISTGGSYRCACYPGYVLQWDGHTCAHEDPEEDNIVREEDRPLTPAATLLEAATQIPPLHNPCAGGGPCSQHCSVVRGLPRCSCFPGFSLKTDGLTCEDVNECVTNTHACQPDERCVNTVGAFMCERQMSCPSGYQLRNGVCEDVDECAVRSHDCKPGAECLNTVGSFHCSHKEQGCLSGFSPDPHGNCIDVDECSVTQEPCTAGFNCINTVGSYTCQRTTMTCNRGYHSSPDGARCVDVDECTTGTHRCTENQMCHNLPGSYRCDCRRGYQYDSIRRICVDVNECWRYPGRLCSQTCENTPGSYQCSCTTGFALALDGKNCEDLNECNNNPCSQECANIYGSYQCYCRLGYYLREDGHTCEDIDECSQSIGNLCTFQCVNVPGSYECACPPEGYSMSANGRTCRDIDECASGTHNCTASQSCYNLQGSFRCLSFTCPENYRKVSDTRCERVSCSNWLECQSMPIRITYYQLSFQSNIVIPAQIFRIGPSPAYSGDSIVISVSRGNEEGYFSTRRLNSFTGAVYLQRQPQAPRDFLIDVEMKLLRQGALSTFLARIYVFITPHAA